jgi:heme/copper-type cytochrome/quinol oxidase subunit 2
MHLRFLINLISGSVITTGFLILLSFIYLIVVEYAIDPQAQWIYSALAGFWLYQPIIWIVAIGIMTFLFYNLIDKFNQKIFLKLLKSYNEK